MSVHAHATEGEIRAYYDQRMQDALRQVIRDVYADATHKGGNVTGHHHALDSGTRMLGRAWTGTAAFGATTGKGRH